MNDLDGGRRPTSSRGAGEIPPIAAVGALLASATGRIATVAAPAGYGKTAQVASWAVGDGRAVGWLDVDAAHLDAGSLALAIFDVLGEVSDVLDAPASPDEAVRVLGRAVGSTETPFILVLDDTHVIDGSPAALAVVESVARHLPPTSTMVVIGRSEPSASLIRDRVHRGLVEVTAVELALDAAGVVQVLDELGVSIDVEVVDQLVARTEGWPIGVRLAARALARAHGHADASHVDHETALYVREEWLAGLADDDVEFLTRIAVLGPCLSGELCDHVLEMAGSAARLEQLRTRCLALARSDRADATCRMHPVLREVLEADLDHRDPGASRACHRRAATWFERAGDTDAAVHHALSAGDLGDAERLLSEHSLSGRDGGPYSAITRWFDAFPDPYLKARPSLCLMAALAAICNPAGGGAVALTWLRYGERALASSVADGDVARRFDAFRALVSTSSVTDGLDDARRALDGLPPGEWHATAALAHGALSFAVGDDQTAEAMLQLAAAEGAISGAPTIAAVSRAHLALLMSTAGDWAEATTLARSARLDLHEQGLEELPAPILVTAMAALVEAKAGNPDQARAEWRRTRENFRHLDGVLPWANVQSRLALARASLLTSDRSGAELLRDEAETLAVAQPDATRAKAQLAELDELLDAVRDRGSWDPSSLTTAELRVLHYLPTNLTMAEIGGRLFISRNTAKTHATAIYRKLAATTRGEAVEAAEGLGLLTRLEDGPRR
jgi:LuxR family maltose regulon positive regulatory protein